MHTKLSIRAPAEAGREHVTPDLDLMPQTAYQISVLGFVWNDEGYWLAMLGDDQATGIQLIQQRLALFFELCGTNLLHNRLRNADIS